VGDYRVSDLPVERNLHDLAQQNSYTYTLSQPLRQDAKKTHASNQFQTFQHN
jgi:hypothetical protein